MRPNDYQRFCRDGERADALAAQGRHADAQASYLALLSELEEKGEIDGYLAAKACVGLLASLCKSGAREAAFGAWNASLEDSSLGLGVYALENAQAGVEDLVRYDMVCAYLHSISAAPTGQAAEAINQYLSRVAEYALDSGDRGLLRLTVSNWKAHLKEAFGSAIPHARAEALIAYERKLGEPARPQPIDFLASTAWAKPEGLRELSRVSSWGSKGAAEERAFEGAAARKLRRP